MLFRGPASLEAHTLAAGRGYAGVGYAGADILAQFGDDFGESQPLIVHIAYGATDDFTLAAGSGIWIIDRSSETLYFHYLAPKLQVMSSGGVSTSLGGRLIVPGWEGAEGFFYGVAVALSATREQLAGHLSVGVDGYVPDGGLDFTVAIGADYSMPLEGHNEFKPFAELRILGSEGEGSEVLCGGIRFLGGGGLAAELGFAKWLEDATKTRPILGLSFRF